MHLQYGTKSSTTIVFYALCLLYVLSIASESVVSDLLATTLRVRVVSDNSIRRILFYISFADAYQYTYYYTISSTSN